MRTHTLSERLLIAIVSEKQDAVANGTDGLDRVRQRLDVLCDALALAEDAERLSARLAVMRSVDPKQPIRIRDWLATRKRGRRRADL